MSDPLRIKPLHGVGQPPFSGIDFSPIHRWLTPAGIPFSRLHDVGGCFGNNMFVDIPNLFRDFDADPADPASYDFAFTDLLITALVEAGVEPFFRLGVTIENYMRIRAYRIHPPKDNLRWAKICEGVIRHYTEGWADGFRYPIRYWEIWNEPENHVDPKKNQMWTGTAEQYFALYNTAATYLKARFPHLKFGGYASCGFYAIRNPGEERTEYFLTFFDNFLKAVKDAGAPLDFFSWHSYGGIEETVEYARYARRKLDEAGFPHTETTCNEWNPEYERRGTFRHASLICGWMLAMQHEPLDSAMFYDARLGISVYGGLFDPMRREPYPAYDAFVAYNELYRRGREIPVSVPGAYAVMAEGEDDRCLVVANPGTSPVPLTLEGEVLSCRMTGEGRRLEEIPVPDAVPPESFLCITLR